MRAIKPSPCWLPILDWNRSVSTLTGKRTRRMIADQTRIDSDGPLGGGRSKSGDPEGSLPHGWH